ncbi:MAG: 30S ribosomal protein S4 [Candidatus Sungbacteria bacterium]|uniref:Small ribosomal subunit protein uS4 n=1 Tax=Candidatus Sungiibacteriota bacterium TaxID=2750080 RepID=A0A9D6QVX4_9BACT|nr:30S ribosomal protein S4 [Candidatus Sungbacteria bacterium]
MSRIQAKCKVCRRYGEKMFMKGERCMGPKCASLRRGTRPGMHGKRPKRNVSEFGTQLMEKQKMRYTYGLTDTALEKVFTEAQQKAGKTGEVLMQILERRLDNVVYRAGFTVSRGIARHIVSHGHVLVNGRRVNIPSYRVRKGDVISIRPQSLAGQGFEGLANALKKYNPPAWISLDPEACAATVNDLPKEEGVGRNLRLVVEFYSK